MNLRWLETWYSIIGTPTLARCRLVVRDFASGAESAFRSGIYAPTSSLDSLRCVLALASLWDLWLITSDVSTAFMYAEVEEDACDLVLLPSNISFKGERVVCLLFKAMNGLRRAPLLWFYQLQRTIYTLGRHRFNLLICLFAIFGLNDLVVLFCFNSVTSNCGSWYADCRALCPGPSSQEDRTLAARSKKKKTIYTLGGEDTFESTLFRIPTKRGVILLLVYVDDL